MRANVPPQVCLVCGVDRRGGGRGLCATHYRQARRDGTIHHYDPTTRSSEEVIVEVEVCWPARGPEDIASALGMTVGAVARALAKGGRPDLAQPFDVEYARGRKATA